MALPVPNLLENHVTCTDVVRCAFDLGAHEVRAYEALNDLGPSKADDVAHALDKDASVVYRNLQKLVGCGIVTKRKATMPEGGYFFVYEALPRDSVKARLRQCVDDWYAQMTRAIARL